jgi:hypothetical protein
MSEIIDFIEENYISIAVIVSIIFALLIIISIREWDLNVPKPKSKLVQEVTIETFATGSGTEFGTGSGTEFGTEFATESEFKMDDMLPASSFCKTRLGKSNETETDCNELTEDNCALTKCCVYVKPLNKCKAGGPDGPTYKKDADGNLITMDSYYYMGLQHFISM